MVLSAGGDVILSSSEDTTARACRVRYSGANSVSWDVVKLTGHARVVSCCALSPDGRLAATGSHDGALRIFDVASAELLQQLPHPGRVSDNGIAAVAFEPRHTLLPQSGPASSSEAPVNLAASHSRVSFSEDFRCLRTGVRF